MNIFNQIPKKYAYVVETVFFFTLLCAANVLFWPQDLGFTKFAFHPFWVAVLFLSAEYGLGAGFLSGTLAGCLYAFFVYQQLPLKGGVEVIAEQGGLLLPFYFVAVGVLLGNIRKKHLLSEQQQEKALADKDMEISRFRSLVEANEKSRKVLEARIVGETSTIKTLYDSARKLDALNTNEVLDGFLEILGQHFQVHKASIYFQEGGFLELKAAFGWPAGAKTEAKVALEQSLMQLVFAQGKRLTVKELLSRPDIGRYSSELGQVLALFPLKDAAGQVKGCVNIERMDFFHFHHANLEILDLLVEWLSAALEKVRFYRSMETRAIWDKENEIFYPHFFETLMREEFERSQTLGQHFSAGLVKIAQFGFCEPQQQRYLAKSLIALLRKRLRSIDKIFAYRVQGILTVVTVGLKASELTAKLTEVQAEFQEMFQQIYEGQGPQGLTFAVTEYHREMKDYQDMLQTLVKGSHVG